MLDAYHNFLVDSQSHLVCKNTVLVVPPILEEPLDPINLGEKIQLSVSAEHKQTNLERHEFQVWALTKVRGSFGDSST